MPLYDADGKKQKPIVNNRILIKKASVPTEFIVQSRPDYIVINSAGTYKFMYETTSSLGTSLASIQAQFETGSVSPLVNSNPPGPYRLDIQPIAWNRCDAGSTVGDITFVSRGKYVQNGGPK